ncbi:AMP-binding protein [Nocardia sp. 004]|uniref:AMP-binding protein n=1 Tax=Nocardia sp. 004 TaxID=3385978 RepID=UPI0039A13CD8
MYTLTDSLTDTRCVQPSVRPTTEIDPHAVVVSAPDCDLTYANLYRWSNRLARLLLRHGVYPGARIAVAIDQTLESVVVERAATTIGASTVPFTGDGYVTAGTVLGITTKDAHPGSSSGITWLVLDERSTLQHYLTCSDAPLSPAALDLLPVAG